MPVVVNCIVLDLSDEVGQNRVPGGCFREDGFGLAAGSATAWLLSAEPSDSPIVAARGRVGHWPRPVRDFFIGLGGVILGVLAMMNVAPAILEFVAFLAIGGALTATASTICGATLATLKGVCSKS